MAPFFHRIQTPESCSFFKWFDSYKKFVERQQVSDDLFSDSAVERVDLVAARPHTPPPAVAARAPTPPAAGKSRIPNEPVDRLYNLMQLLVLISVVQVVLVFLGLCMLISK